MNNYWQPYQPSEQQPWNLRRVVALFRRAGLGGTWNEIQAALSQGPDETISRLLSGTARSEGVPDDFEEMSAVIGDSAVASSMSSRLKAWWLYRMLLTPDPLTERLTFVWHNHFATSNLKIDDLSLMRQQNEIFREYSRAPFGELLRRVLKDPAMLVWLDAPANRKQHPNENLARELMELFTLGIAGLKDGSPNYTEDDVKQAARALTGRSVVRNEFRIQAGHHDDGEKVILGRRGTWTSEDLVDILLDHPATGERLAWRLCDAFFGEDVVSPEQLIELAAGLRDRELNIGWAVETILRSQIFHSDANLNSQVIDPAGFVAGNVRAVELLQPPSDRRLELPSTLILSEWLTRLGQDLFYPPNVGGWSGGRSWLSSRAIVQRANFGAALARGELCAPPKPPNLVELIGRHGVAASLDESLRFFAALLVGGLPQAALVEITTAAESASPDLSEQLKLALALVLARPEAQMI